MFPRKRSGLSANASYVARQASGPSLVSIHRHLANCLYYADCGTVLISDFHRAKENQSTAESAKNPNTDPPCLATIAESIPASASAINSAGISNGVANPNSATDKSITADALSSPLIVTDVSPSGSETLPTKLACERQSPEKNTSLTFDEFASQLLSTRSASSGEEIMMRLIERYSGHRAATSIAQQFGWTLPPPDEAVGNGGVK
jgi:hypothetical protein